MTHLGIPNRGMSPVCRGRCRIVRHLSWFTLVLLIGGLIVPQATFGQQNELQVTDIEKSVLDLVNQEREKSNIGKDPSDPKWAKPLLPNTKLFMIARSHAKNMAVQGADHILDGKNPTQRGEAVGFVGFIGENWASGDPTPKDVVASWMASKQGHREGMLDYRARIIGVGLAQSRDGTNLWCINYSGSAVESANPPRLVVTQTGGKPTANVPPQPNTPAANNPIPQPNGFSPSVIVLNPFEKGLFEAINAERTKARLPVLKINLKLNSASNYHAAHMAIVRQLDHVLDGKSPTDRVRALGYPSEVEEVSNAGADNAERAVQNWMDVPQLQAKLLNPQVTEFGVGYAVTRDGTNVWNVVLGNSREAANPPQVEFMKVATPQTVPEPAAVAQAGPNNSVRPVIVLSPPMKGLLDAINVERARAGVPALIPNFKLFLAADNHARHMATIEQMNHVLNGKTPTDRGRALGYPSDVDEVFNGGAVTAERAVENWMDAPNLRAKLLNPTTTEIGIGYAVSRDTTNVWNITLGASAEVANPPRIEFAKLSQPGPTAPTPQRASITAVSPNPVSSPMPAVAPAAPIDPSAGSVSYWLAQSQPGDTSVSFRVRVPEDVATKVIRRSDDKATGYKTFQRTIGGRTYDFFQNDLCWEASAAARGNLSFLISRSGGGVGGGETWEQVRTDGAWPQFKQALDRQAKPLEIANGWFKATPLIVAYAGDGAPDIQFNRVGPFDTAGAPSDQANYHSTKPQIMAALADGGMIVGWNEYASGRLVNARLTRIVNGQDKFIKAWEKTLPLPALGGVATDGTNAYVLCASNEDLLNDKTTANYRPGVLQLVKFDRSGNQLWVKDLNNEQYLGGLDSNGLANRGVYSPFVGGTGQLEYGNGRLLVSLACNTLPDARIGGVRHQRAMFFTVGEDGSGSQSFAESSGRHSFDQRVLFDGTDFVIAEVGDAGWYMPAAGIAIRKAKPNANGGAEFVPAAAEGVYIYARRGNGDSYSNTSFTSLGNLALGDRGYVALFSSQISNGQPPVSGFESPVPEPRNLAMVHVVKNFEAVQDATMYADFQPEGKPIPGNVSIDFRNQSYKVGPINITNNVVDSNGPTSELITRADNPERTFRQHGIVWLTNHGAGVSVERPRLIRLSADRYMALWEEWTYTGTGQNLKYQATKAMLIGEYGNVLQAARPVNARLNPAGADRLFQLGTGAAWLTGDTGSGKLTLHLVDANLNTTSFEIGL